MRVVSSTVDLHRKPEDILPDVPEHLREILALYLFCRFLGFKHKQIRFERASRCLSVWVSCNPEKSLKLDVLMNWAPQDIIEKIAETLLVWRRKMRGLSTEERRELTYLVVFENNVSACFAAFLLQLIEHDVALPRAKDPEVESCVSVLLRIETSKLPHEISYLSIIERDALALWTLLRVGGVSEENLDFKVAKIKDDRCLCIEVRWGKNECLMLGVVSAVPDTFQENEVRSIWQRNLAIYKSATSKTRATLVVESRMSSAFPALVSELAGVGVDVSKVQEYLQTVRAEQGIS